MSSCDLSGCVAVRESFERTLLWLALNHPVVYAEWKSKLVWVDNSDLERREVDL